METFDQAKAHIDAMTPEERAALTAKYKGQGFMTLAVVAGAGFLVLGPVGLVAGPAAVMGLALLMGNR